MQLRRTLGLADVVLFFVVAGSNLQWVATAAAAGASSISVWLIGGLAMFAPIAIAVVFLSSQSSRRRRHVRLEQARLRAVCGIHYRLDVLGEQSSIFSGAALLRGRQRALHRGREGRSVRCFAPVFHRLCTRRIDARDDRQRLRPTIGKWLNNAGAVSRWLVTLLLLVLGALRVVQVRFGDDRSTPRRCARASAIKDMIFWSVIAFAWTGPESMPFMGGEIKNPRRTIPLGLAIAAPAIAIIYIGGTISVLAAASSARRQSIVGSDAGRSRTLRTQRAGTCLRRLPPRLSR